jgi:hypothetical protein
MASVDQTAIEGLRDIVPPPGFPASPSLQAWGLLIAGTIFVALVTAVILRNPFRRSFRLNALAEAYAHLTRSSKDLTAIAPRLGAEQLGREIRRILSRLVQAEFQSATGVQLQNLIVSSLPAPIRALAEVLRVVDSASYSRQWGEKELRQALTATERELALWIEEERRSLKK